MAFLSWLWTGDRIWKDDVIGRADLLYPHQATLKGSERLSLSVKQIALPQKEVLVRLAGYDWVPETKLKRSLRESWQRGRAWRSRKKRRGKKEVCWLASCHTESVRLQPWQCNSSVCDWPAGTEEVSGVVLGYCIYEKLPWKISNWCCNCNFWGFKWVSWGGELRYLERAGFRCVNVCKPFAVWDENCTSSLGKKNCFWLSCWRIVIKMFIAEILSGMTRRARAPLAYKETAWILFNYCFLK